MGKTLRALRLCRMQRAAVQTADLCRGVADKKERRQGGAGIRIRRCGKSVPVFCRLRQHGRFDAGRRGAFKAGAQEDPLRELDFFLSSEQARFDGYCTAMRHAGYTVQAEDLLSHRDMDRLVVHKSIKNG